jgi:hypothetical protein
MDDQNRNDLLAQLVDARKRETHTRQQLRAHIADIEQVRKKLGNPYFYSARPAEDPESEAYFTGFKSAEPAFALWPEWQEVSRELAEIRKALQKSGLGSA